MHFPHVLKTLAGNRALRHIPLFLCPISMSTSLQVVGTSIWFFVFSINGISCFKFVIIFCWMCCRYMYLNILCLWCHFREVPWRAWFGSTRSKLSVSHQICSWFSRRLWWCHQGNRTCKLNYIWVWIHAWSFIVLYVQGNVLTAAYNQLAFYSSIATVFFLAALSILL